MTEKIAHLKAPLDTPLPIAADTALVPYTIGTFTFTASGISVDRPPTYEEWEDVGKMLAVQVRGIQFIVGDWLLLGETHFGEAAAQAIDSRSWSEETVRNYLWVAKNVPMENRRDDLTFAHHQLVAGLKPQEQRKWLKRAATDDPAGPWPVSRLRAAVRKDEDEEPTAWCVLVEATTQAKRDELQKRLELEGHQCKAVERRGGRRAGD
jgi:hypothetical protein